MEEGKDPLGPRTAGAEIKSTLPIDIPIATRRALLAEKLVGNGVSLSPGKTASKGMQSYYLRIVTAGAVTPTAGVAASSFFVDPSNIPISEWSTIAGLFEEVRVKSFSVTVAPYLAPGLSMTGPMISSLAMSSCYSKTSIPSNIVSVLTQDDGELISPLMVKAHTHRMRVPQLGFAPTSAPSGTTFYGCPGSIQLYATGTGTQSLLTYFVCGVYELRGRV